MILNRFKQFSQQRIPPPQYALPSHEHSRSRLPGGAAISIQNLTKYYGNIPALQNLTLEVPPGAIFAFLGLNGAGKSTTLKILAGLTPATSGSAHLNDVLVTQEGQHRRYLGYLAQEPRFYGWMTGREVLKYVARFYGGVSKHWINELIERVGIAAIANRPCRNYSKGMLQRLGIAQALVGKPAVVMLDEPVCTLDPIGRTQVLDLMQELRGETTILYSTPMLDDVRRVSDYVAILNQGQLVKTAPTQELLGGFTKGSLCVTLMGADETTVEVLKQLPGVSHSSLIEHRDNLWVYTVQTTEILRVAVQHRITRFAAEHDLALITNEPMELEVETVFLRLLGTQPNSSQSIE
jgi:ABC-2 type transport system ATP-binding protein